MERLGLAWKGISPCTPGPLAPNPCSAPGHGHMSSWVLRRPKREKSGLPLLVGADQSPDKGPELAGKNQEQTLPMGGLRGCHRHCHGHP